MTVYLSAKRILLFVLCSEFTFALINIADIPWSLYLLNLSFSALLLTAYMLWNLDIILQKKYLLVNVLSLVYASSTLVSPILGGDLSPHLLSSYFLHISLLPFVEIQREKGHVRFLYKVLAFWLPLFLIANDILMVIMPGRFYGDGISKTFLLGGKFSTSYNHMVFLLIVCLLYGERLFVRRVIPLLFAVVCLLCRYMDCNTAALGTIVFFAIAYSPKGIQSVLSRRAIVLVALILCALFVYSENVFMLPPVKYFITEVLGRDVTLTGRSQIYQVLGKVIRAHPWIGYGSSAEIMFRYTGAFNAQNGFFDLVVQNGFPSALLYELLVLTLVREGSTTGSKFLLGIMYGYFFMSTVEITFDITLLMFGILLFTESEDYTEKPIRIFEWGCATVDSCTSMRQ